MTCLKSSSQGVTELGLECGSPNTECRTFTTVVQIAKSVAQRWWEKPWELLKSRRKLLKNKKRVGKKMEPWNFDGGKHELPAAGSTEFWSMWCYDSPCLWTSLGSWPWGCCNFAFPSFLPKPTLTPSSLCFYWCYSVCILDLGSVNCVLRFFFFNVF